MEREFGRWTLRMLPTLATAKLPPRGSMTGDWAEVLATLHRLQKKARKEV
jgi:hypothetical protein